MAEPITEKTESGTDKTLLKKLHASTHPKLINIVDPTLDDVAHLETIELVDHYFKEEERLFTEHCLNKLGLYEKIGLDGQEMLYPKKKKDRKLERHEVESMVSRLYTPKRYPDPFYHMNEKSKSEFLKSIELEKSLHETHKKHVMKSSSTKSFLSPKQLNSGSGSASFFSKRMKSSSSRDFY